MSGDGVPVIFVDRKSVLSIGGPKNVIPSIQLLRSNMS